MRKPIAGLDKASAQSTPSEESGDGRSLTVQQVGKASVVGSVAGPQQTNASEMPRVVDPGRRQEITTPCQLKMFECGASLVVGTEGRTLAGIPDTCVRISGRWADDRSEGGCVEIADHWRTLRSFSLILSNADARVVPDVNVTSNHVRCFVDNQLAPFLVLLTFL